MIHTQDADFVLYQGDVLEDLAGLPSESVHCVVTSPPYWGLRDYSTIGQLGLEPTPDAYITRMVEVFREVRRVLRADGTLWLNIGDSYAAGKAGRADGDRRGVDGFTGGRKFEDEGVGFSQRSAPPGYKPKDLVGIPWKLALALQADGWYLRADIIWAKPNPMPESVTDRPTKSHEYVFLLTRSPRYFFDQEAVRETLAESTLLDRRQINGIQPPRERNRGGRTDGYTSPGGLAPAPAAGRNVRSVWEIATQPYPEAHFATYPEELVRRCILAGTSERGCCPVCGTPWERMVELGGLVPTDDRNRKTFVQPKYRGELDADDKGAALAESGFKSGYRRQMTQLGWEAGCDCRQDGELRAPLIDPFAPIPCTVLDPFLGSGTTAHVARKHGRRSIGIELNAAYCQLAARRLQQQSLFSETPT
jgi:DNA modification methylase